MNYFEDLNPYFVRQDPDAEVNPDGTLMPPKNPNPAAVPQIYMGNIIRLNIGKLGTFISLIVIVRNGEMKFLLV